MAEQDPEHPNPKVLWRQRRYMAWAGIGFSGLCIAGGIAMSLTFPTHADTTVIPLATTGFWGGLIPMGGYMGNCIASDVASIKAGV